VTAKWTKNIFPLKQLSIGVDLSLETFTLKATHDGPHIQIQASVHGAEIQGNALIFYLMENLAELLKVGSVTFIPLANPYATLQKSGTYTLGRNNPVTGNNWNRNFIDILRVTNFNLDKYTQEKFSNKAMSDSEIKNKFKEKLKSLYEDYELELRQLEQFNDNNRLNFLLQKISAQADFVLDLHTGPIATEYIYGPRYSLSNAKHFNIPHILVTPDYFAGAMDEAFCVPWIELNKSLKFIGRTTHFSCAAFTVELGSEERFSMLDATRSAQGVYNFLAKLGMIDDSESLLTQFRPISKFSISELIDFKTIYAPVGGLYDYKIEVGESFKQGDILAVCYQKPQFDEKNQIPRNSKLEIIASWDGILINRCPSSNVHQGMELYQCMTNITNE
jgi:predicted deacylase